MGLRRRLADGGDRGRAVLTDEAFLHGLSDEEHADLLAVGTRRRYPPGSVLFFVEEPAHEVLVVLAGEAKAIVPGTEGREVILDVVGEGALLGELASLDQGPRSATVQALGDLEVLAVPADRFAAYLTEHPAVLRNIALHLVGRLRQSDRRQLEFGTGDSLSRLGSRLLELAARYGTELDDGTVRIESPLSQSELASWAGLSREAVVKAMRALRRLGWIENDGRSITILELDELRLRASH